MAKGEVTAIPAIGKDGEDLGYVVIQSTAKDVRQGIFLSESKLSALRSKKVDITITNSQIWIQGVGIRAVNHAQLEEEAKRNKQLQQTLGYLFGGVDPNHSAPDATVEYRTKPWWKAGWRRQSKFPKKGRGYGQPLDEQN